MRGWALFSEKDLFLRFTMSAAGSVEKTPYALGGALTDFTAVSPQISEKLFFNSSKKIRNRRFHPNRHTDNGRLRSVFA